MFVIDATSTGVSVTTSGQYRYYSYFCQFEAKDAGQNLGQRAGSPGTSSRGSRSRVGKVGLFPIRFCERRQTTSFLPPRKY